MNHEEMEERAAVSLGRFLVGFSRLEFVIALAIANIARQRGPAWPEDARRRTLEARLQLVKEHIAQSSELEPAAKERYSQWIVQVKQLQRLRNKLIHGRWVFEPQQGVVCNVVEGHAGKASTTDYTLEALATLANRPRELHAEYTRLIHREPF